jgi:hypothetical protein
MGRNIGDGGDPASSFMTHIGESTAKFDIELGYRGRRAAPQPTSLAWCTLPIPPPIGTWKRAVADRLPDPSGLSWSNMAAMSTSASEGHGQAGSAKSVRRKPPCVTRRVRVNAAPGERSNCSGRGHAWKIVASSGATGVIIPARRQGLLPNCMRSTKSIADQ